MLSDHDECKVVDLQSASKELPLTPNIPLIKTLANIQGEIQSRAIVPYETHTNTSITCYSI